jgi:hypothetical protein
MEWRRRSTAERFMAYDSEPGGDPRGPWCKGCKAPILKDQPSTRMRFDHDPDGALGMTGLWHSECARPYWDRITPLLKRLNWLPGAD